MATPNGSSGAPSLRYIVGADVPAINLGASGNGGVSGSLPVGDLAPGINGQCTITSGGGSEWGSCSGTAGVQLLSLDTTAATADANTSSVQNLMSYAVSAGAWNSVGKTFRLTIGGFFGSLANTTETVFVSVNLGSTSLIKGARSTAIPASTAGGGVALQLTCSVITSGSSSSITCAGPINVSWDCVSSGCSQALVAAGNPISGIDLTSAQTLQVQIQFGTASTSNSFTETNLQVEQMN